MAPLEPPTGASPYRPLPVDNSREWTAAARGLHLLAWVFAASFVLFSSIGVMETFARHAFLRAATAPLGVRLATVSGVLRLVGLAGVVLVPLGYYGFSRAPRWTRVRAPALWAMGLGLFETVAGYASQFAFMRWHRHEMSLDARVRLLSTWVFARAGVALVLDVALMTCFLVAIARARRSAGAGLPWWAIALIVAKVVWAVASVPLSTLLVMRVYTHPDAFWLKDALFVPVGAVLAGLKVALVVSTRRLLLTLHDIAPTRAARAA